MLISEGRNQFLKSSRRARTKRLKSESCNEFAPNLMILRPESSIGIFDSSSLSAGHSGGEKVIDGAAPFPTDQAGRSPR